MLGRFFRFVENGFLLLVGTLFSAVGVGIAKQVPGSESPLVVGYLAFLLFHTAAMAIIGGYLKKAQRFWALSWFFALLFFFVVVLVFRP